MFCETNIKYISISSVCDNWRFASFEMKVQNPIWISIWRSMPNCRIEKCNTFEREKQRFKWKNEWNPFDAHKTQKHSYEFGMSFPWKFNVEMMRARAQCFHYVPELKCIITPISTKKGKMLYSARAVRISTNTHTYGYWYFRRCKWKCPEMNRKSIMWFSNEKEYSAKKTRFDRPLCLLILWLRLNVCSSIATISIVFGFCIVDGDELIYCSNCYVYGCCDCTRASISIIFYW